MCLGVRVEGWGYYLLEITDPLSVRCMYVKEPSANSNLASPQKSLAVPFHLMLNALPLQLNAQLMHVFAL